MISDKFIEETAMKVLHLICTLETGSNSKRKGLRPIPGTSPLRFKSGWWDFTVKQIEELMGGKVYLHNTKRTASFVGGTVVDYKEFDITFGLYMPQDNSITQYGTQFWKPDFEADMEESLLREDCTLLKQLPFQHNLCYIMPRSKYSWHSSPILDKPMRRNHVYGNYKAI